MNPVRDDIAVFANKITNMEATKRYMAISIIDGNVLINVSCL